jgi:hypothetical protein
MYLTNFFGHQSVMADFDLVNVFLVSVQLHTLQVDSKEFYLLTVGGITKRRFTLLRGLQPPAMSTAPVTGQRS